MIPFMRSRVLSRAMICAGLLMASALAAATPVPAQQSAPATVQQRPGDATGNLFDAVQANDLAAVQASIAAGADVTAKDQWGLTPIDLAIDKSYFDVAHFLLSVRNFQDNAGAPGRSTPARQAATGPGPSAPAAATINERRPERARAATGVAVDQATPTEAPRRQPAQPWPANQPNPFDPARPAPGAVLPGDGVGEAFRGTGHTAAAERPPVQ
jgi:hypothetical protein